MNAIRKRIEGEKRESIINDLCDEYRKYLEQYSTYALKELDEGNTFVFQERVFKENKRCCE